MAKFKFRLATLLRLRESLRDGRRSELGEAYRVDDVLKTQLDQVDDDLGALRTRRRNVCGLGSVDVDQLLESQRYELALQVQQQQIHRQRQTVAEEIERRRQSLVEANRDVRVLEKLRDKQQRRHHQEESRREIKQLDEVAQQRAVREYVR